MHFARISLALAGICLTLLPSRALAQIQLEPVVSNLTSPVFVGHAGDGLNRLFIVEQAGKIKVLQQGASTPTDFLDLSAKISTGIAISAATKRLRPRSRHPVAKAASRPSPPPSANESTVVSSATPPVLRAP